MDPVDLSRIRTPVGHVSNVPLHDGTLETCTTIGSPSWATEWDTLLRLRQEWKQAGKTVVWTNGCFDLLHVGHLRSLQAARRLGDVLVVGLNSDESVRRLKGPTRPIVPQAERVEMLASLRCVDHVVVFEESTPDAALARLQPDIHCKGSDYAPPHGKPVPEAALVESYGGRVEFLPLVPDTSTTLLLRRIEDRLQESTRLSPEPPSS